MSIVPELLTSCAAGTLIVELTAQNVSLYHRSPFSIYCEKFVPPERKAPLGPYRELLLERGIEHEMATKFVKDWLVARSGSENGSAWFRVSIVFPLQGLAGMVDYLLV
jgi:hypothetical protein